MKQATFTPFPADWARSSHFQYYTKGFVKSVNSMTVRIDVTHFLAEVHCQVYENNVVIS